MADTVQTFFFIILDAAWAWNGKGWTGQQTVPTGQEPGWNSSRKQTFVWPSKCWQADDKSTSTGGKRFDHGERWSSTKVRNCEEGKYWTNMDVFLLSVGRFFAQ